MSKVIVSTSVTKPTTGKRGVKVTKANLQQVAKDIFKVFESNKVIAKKVNSSPEFYRALVYETGIVEDPKSFDGTALYDKLVDALEDIENSPQLKPEPKPKPSFSIRKIIHKGKFDGVYFKITVGTKSLSADLSAKVVKLLVKDLQSFLE